MKYLASLLTGVCLIVFSCEKPANDTPRVLLDGSWMMVSVTDRATGVVEYKPNLVRGDVVINFNPTSTSGGSFSGNTPSNFFGPDQYSLSFKNRLTLRSMHITEVVESSWGKLFLHNIPNDSKVTIEYSEMFIETPAKTLRFKRN